MLVFAFLLHAENMPSISLYPNPADKFVKVNFSELPADDIRISISDILGNRIETLNFKASESVLIDLESLHLSAGMYLIRIETGAQLYSKKLLVKNNLN